MELRTESSRIALYDGQVEIGEITWIAQGDVIAVNHTYVDPEYRGQNLAQKLLDACVQYARDMGFKIKPDCPYVLKMFERFDVYQDVWAQ